MIALLQRAVSEQDRNHIGRSTPRLRNATALQDRVAQELDKIRGRSSCLLLGPGDSRPRRMTERIRMNPSSLPAPGRREQLRVGLHAAVRIVVTTTLLFVVYALVPVASVSSISTVLRLIAGLVLVTAVIGWEVRAILTASYPRVRAIEAVVTAVTLVIIVFALLYLGLAQAHPANFTQPLDRVSAVYFTVTILATVGFGDISAHTDSARLAVTIQMVLDLALLAVIVHVFLWAARTGVERRHDQPPS
jgi:hypothetical protein